MMSPAKGARETVRRKRGSILRATAGVLLILVPLTLGVGGCRGAFKPVEWSELGADANRDEARQEPRSDSGSRRQSRDDRPRRESRNSRNSEELRVVAKSNREVARLSPDDIVCIMQRVGFSDDQILDLGTDLYNALSLSGGAEVYYGKGMEMIFAINNHQVQIQSRSRGTFVYDIAKKRFVLGASGR